MSESNIVSLGKRRMLESGDARKWTALDALRAAVADVEAGRVNPEKIYIAALLPGDDGGLFHWCAGCNMLETIGLLHAHVSAVSEP